MHCSVSLKLWQCVLPPGSIFSPSRSIPQLLDDWDKNHPRSLKKKPIIRWLWNIIPKNICWQLWIARNRAIFKDQKAVPTRIVSKSVGMIAEKFASNSISFPHSENIMEPHASWCKIYLKDRNSPQSNTTISKQPHSKHTCKEKQQ